MSAVMGILYGVLGAVLAMIAVLLPCVTAYALLSRFLKDREP